jgi:hypothetical protein
MTNGEAAPPVRARSGNYVGTEVDGRWWRRYRARGFFARGNGKYWWDDGTFYFLRLLTRRPLEIPFDRVEAVRTGRSHAGRSAPWLRILKIDWTENGHRLSSGFFVSSDSNEVENLAAELRDLVQGSARR